MQYGICTGPENAAKVKSAGYDFIELNVQSHLLPTGDESSFSPLKQQILEAELPAIAANCFLPGSLRSTGPDVDLEAILDYARTAFSRAEMVGIRTIVFGSGGSRRLDPDTDKQAAIDQFIAINAALAPIALDHGVTIVIEPLHAAECNFINTLAEGAQIVQAVDHPACRLLCDFYHMLKDGDPAEEVVIHGDLIHHAHIAEPANRTAPGIEGTDFHPFISALEVIGYDGGLAVEASFPNSLEIDAPLARRRMQEAAEL